MKKLILSLIAVSSISAETTIEQGRPLKFDQISAGILQSARFEVRDKWGFGINAHFNEYASSEDSMELAYTSNSSKNSEGSVLLFDSDYHPGFEVGFVLNTPYDHWNIRGNYLWFQGSENFRKETNPSEFYVAPVFSPSIFNELITSINSKWNLNINTGDLYLTRPYYSGRNLTLEPLMGLKAAFVKQDFNILAILFDAPASSQTAETKSISWGIGPKLGLQANYLLGTGFSIFGDLSTALLYTTYTKIHLDYANSLGQTSFASNNNAEIIQPIIDTEIGFSFGSYAFRKNFYVNFTAAYNFSVFFSQNMSRALVSTVGGRTALPANLYLQGVSLGLAFVF